MTGVIPVPLAEALVAALSELTTVDRGRTANAGSYSYSYADLGDLVRATRPVLAAHGLVALTPVHGADGSLAVTVILYHSSGGALVFEPLPFPPGRDAQSTGSAMTYFRRYALLAALGMATEDDDGAKSVAPEPPDRTATIRRRLGKVHHDLDEEQRALLREWLETEGLPDRASLMTAEQAERTLAWIVSEEGPG